MYFALMQTQLFYGLISKKETTQKWILIIMLRKTYSYPSHDLYKEPELLDIRQIYILTLFIHRRKYGIDIKLNDNRYLTRHKDEYVDRPRNSAFPQRKM